MNGVVALADAENLTGGLYRLKDLYHVQPCLQNYMQFLAT